MMTHDPALATAADYADALITARRAKNLLVLLVLLMLLGQLGLFFTAKYGKDYIPVQNPPATVVPAGTASAITATIDQMASAATQPAIQPTSKVADLLQYAVGLSGFLGITLSVVLALVELLLVMIMLVGRLIGVSRVTSAFIWSIILIVLLFPWQAFLADAHFASDFKIPGVLYTWNELVKYAKVGVAGDNPGTEQLILHWSRFVAFPVIAVIITLMIQVKSNRGLREALGEGDSVLTSENV